MSFTRAETLQPDRPRVIRFQSPASLVKLSALGVAGLMLLGLATVFTATHIVEQNLKTRAFVQLNISMTLCWRLLHELGPTATVTDGRLTIGNTVLNDNQPVLRDLTTMLGNAVTIFQGDERVLSSVRDASGNHIEGTHLAPGPARDTVLDQHHPFRGIVSVVGVPYFAAYDPILDAAGRQIGILFVGLRTADILAGLHQARLHLLEASAIGALVFGGIFLFIARQLANRLAQREHAMREASRELEIALDAIASGLCRWSASHTLIVTNKRIADILGIPAASLQIGMHFRTFLWLCQQAGRFAGRDLQEVYQTSIDMVDRREPVSFIDRSIKGRIIAVGVRPIDDGGWLATYDDISEREKAEAQIAYLARHDVLTGVANRLLFNDRLAEALTRGWNTAVLCLDLDRFNHINDTLGHAVGDLMLKSVAARLMSCLRTDDTVARLGGDGFGVVIRHLARPEDARAAAERMMAAISEPHDLDGHRASVGLSIGIALAGRNSRDPQLLLQQAELALSHAKADGGNVVRIFEVGMDEYARARRSLESDLRLALSGEEFAVFYQPIVEICSCSVTSFEALLRWQHPARGRISPAEFIPVAEATGLIIPIGAWVLHRACAQAAAWPVPVKVAVNLSPVQFRDNNLVATIRGALAESGLPPDRLILEITETVMVHEADATSATLHELRALGIQIALDDFGTGYSSLSYVRNFPFDKIKIDRSFVDGIGLRTDSAAIIRAVTGLASSLGMKTVAEGVETREQFRWLAQAGCDNVQGYLFSRPRPADEVPKMLAEIAAWKTELVPNTAWPNQQPAMRAVIGAIGPVRPG